MAGIRVKEYTALWEPQGNRYAIEVIFDGESQKRKLNVNSENEFLAFLLMLDKPGVLYDHGTRAFIVPPRVPGT